MMDKQPRLEELLEKLPAMLPELEQRYQVSEVAPFGSHVREAGDPESDLDVLVSFHDTPSLLRYWELENLLSDRLGVLVDLVMRGALKPRIGQRILPEIVPAALCGISQ